MTKHLTGVPPVRTTHASSFKKIGDPESGSWNRVCVKFQQLIRTFTQHARNALPLLCPDGAAGVAARDEAVQPRPLCEQHHQGGRRGSLLDLGRGGGRGRLLALEAARASNSPACCHHTPTLLLSWLPPLEAATAESRSSVPLLLGERLARHALGERLHAADPPLSSCTRQTVHLAALQPSPPPAAASYPPQPQPSPLPPPQPLLPPPRP